MTDFALETQEPSETERLRRPRPERPTLVWRCAWCGRPYRQPDDMPLTEHWMETLLAADRLLNGGESHGMCLECLERESGKWELSEGKCACINAVVKP